MSSTSDKAEGDDYITSRVMGRMKVGKEKYGHGLVTAMNTTQWGTKIDSWLEMAEEEYMDALVYVLADYIREENIFTRETEDDNELIVELLKTPEKIKSDFHRSSVNNLQSLIHQNLAKYRPHRSHPLKS